MSTCDNCGVPIVRENADDDFLRLIPEKRAGGGAVTDMSLPPELEREHTFCDMACLCQWAARQISSFTGKPYSR